MPVLVDTSVLLRLRDPADPRHPDCKKVLEPNEVTRHGICLCAQVLIEYWVVATRPVAVRGLGLSAADAEIDIHRLRTQFACLPEPPDIVDRWLATVTRHQVIGKTAHDARIVTLMEAHGVRRLLTLNPSDFRRYPHIEVFSPSELLAAGPPP